MTGTQNCKVSGAKHSEQGAAMLQQWEKDVIRKYIEKTFRGVPKKDSHEVAL